MVKISYIILNIFFLPGARAPPKLNVASPLAMAAMFLGVVGMVAGMVNLALAVDMVAAVILE